MIQSTASIQVPVALGTGRANAGRIARVPTGLLRYLHYFSSWSIGEALLLVAAMALLGFKLSLALGDPSWSESRVLRMSDLAGTFGLLIFAYILRHFQSRLALIDGLTGTLNRKGLDAFLKRFTLTTFARPHWVSMLAIDIDHFKNVNDEHGHNAGDEVLRTISGLIHKSVRNKDAVIRHGGDEFVVILREASPRACRLVARRIQRVTRAALQTNYGASVSIGALSVWTRRFSYERCFTEADALLYSAKRYGRDHIVFKAISGVPSLDANVVVD